MKNRHKILTINILVVFITILTFLTGVFSVIMKMFFSKDGKTSTISVAAESTITFKKEGLLDLIGEGITVDISNPINLNTKEDVISAYNNYVNNYFNTGKVTATASTFGISGGSFMGITGEYYTIFNQELSFKDDVFYCTSVYCKIPNASGDDDGPYAPNNFIEEKTIKDGVITIRKTEGGKDVCYYVCENGQYKIIQAKTDYVSKATGKCVNPNYLLPFEINESTVKGCDIDLSSNFVAKVKIYLNDSALQLYKEEIKLADEGNKDYPTFTKMELEISFNRFTGEIIEIYKSEVYSVPNVATISMNRSTNIAFKKED